MPKLASDTDAIPAISDLLAAPEIRRALDFLKQNNGFSDKELIAICEIAAPPFKEHRRAEYVAEQLEQLDIGQVTIDDVGNVLARWTGAGGNRSHPRLADPSLQTGDSHIVVISAHLDTVFPEETDVRVRREGSRLYAPGVSDNACGIASLLSLARAMSAGRISTSGTVLLAATVGEEGEGNLRGVRHLFATDGFRDRVSAFVSLDGPGLERITSRALGSRRFRVMITGPGGHSWGDFGIVNPVHALGRAIARFAAYPAPLSPRTAFNVGVIEGGNSVNAIPERASMTVDARSLSVEEIDRIESYLRRVVDIAVKEENTQRAMSGTGLESSIELIGDRPSGETPPESQLVQTAIECSRILGIEPRLDCSSTDSNIPISLGIPAITIGVGGQSGNCHSLTEWYEPTGRELGLKRLLLLTVALAGLVD
jgi:acetylornithine deacetylase/succinyl-diaminopimelate desuccinylase-like protein